MKFDLEPREVFWEFPLLKKSNTRNSHLTAGKTSVHLEEKRQLFWSYSSHLYVKYVILML